jgi:hypothetical protein
MNYLYRGVHAKHPALQDAQNGVVRAADPSSDISATRHNRGSVSDVSPFTSWTLDMELAIWHSRRNGPGGVLLRVPAGAPTDDDTWNWEYSEDRYFESEVLMRGVRLDVEVIEI